MALFGKKSEGGIADVIRCDEPEYLVWKWSPSGVSGNSNRENSIRWGSSLRVKDGEVAVFVYKQSNGDMHDFIVGPYDQTLKTANFPILSSVLGAAFDGASPFQAEVYFINLAGNNQIRFGVQYFDVFDPRFLDFAVPVSATGSITFNVTDYKAFIKLNRLIQFDMNDFYYQVSDAVSKYVKSVIANCPLDNGIPVLQLERKILEINELIKPHLEAMFVNDFGVNLKRFDLSSIEVDKASDGYAELRKVTAVQQTKTTEASTDINIRNLDDAQQINALDMAEKLRIQRKGAELHTEVHHLDAHRLNLQAGVLQAAAQNLGSMGNMGGLGGTGDQGGLNPAGLMMGMALGGAMGGQMANMANQMGQNISQGSNVMPPPPPQSMYSVSVNGETQGPFSIQQLQQLVMAGALNRDTFVWKQGMAEWQTASSVGELQGIFNTMPPPPPPAG